MTSIPVTRRLAAIVIADVVGYTRLMEGDEAGTHARLREIRDNVTDPRIAEFGGRIVKTAGDGMLVEFPSAAAALRCAVGVQREMGHRNLYVAAAGRQEPAPEAFARIHHCAIEGDPHQRQRGLLAID